MARGAVQGVFFRDSTRSRAEELGLTGWVRNRDDGAVEAEFQGAPQDVDGIIDFCRADPGSADVEGLDVDDIDVVDGEQGFDVRQ